MQQHLVSWGGGDDARQRREEGRVDLAMNPDGGGFAGWAICKVQGPLLQNKLAAAGGARTSAARLDLWDGLTWPAQWWVPALPGDVIQQQTRIAWRAAHHPSKMSVRCKQDAGE